MNNVNISRQLELFTKYYAEISQAIDRKLSLQIDNLLTHVAKLLDYKDESKSAEDIFKSNYNTMEITTTISEIFENFAGINLSDTSLTQSRQYTVQDIFADLKKNYQKLLAEMIEQQKTATNRQFSQLMEICPPINIENVQEVARLFRKYNKSYQLYVKYMKYATSKASADFLPAIMHILERDKSDVLKHSTRAERPYTYATFSLSPAENEFLSISDLCKKLSVPVVKTFDILATKIKHPVLVIYRCGAPIYTVLTPSYTFPDGLCKIGKQPLQKLSTQMKETKTPFKFFADTKTKDDFVELLVIENVGDFYRILRGKTQSKYPFTARLDVRNFLENDFSRPYNYNRILESKYIPTLKNVEEYKNIKEEKVDMEPVIKVGVAFVKQNANKAISDIIKYLNSQEFSKMFQTTLDIKSAYKTTVVYLLDWLENEFRNDLIFELRNIKDATVTEEYLRQITVASLKSILDKPDNIYHILRKKEALVMP